MRRALALLLLSLTPACAYAPDAAPTQDTATGTVWLDYGQLGWEEQQAWGMPLPLGFGVGVLPPDLFLANCNAVVGGCSPRTLGFAELAEDRVWLRSDLSGDRLHATLLHEMGHVLRGEGGHLAEDGNVMSELATGLLQPTPDDYAFVLHADW